MECSSGSWDTESCLDYSKGVEKILRVDQAGFRKDRSTGEQVPALTTYIENGLDSKLKTGTVFLDLTAAYDTVWHKGLLLKTHKSAPCLGNSNNQNSANQPEVQSSPWTE
ncbi:hypothetical protein SKAU_G00037790 [Synaphobranchus kaupii]|uniref:Reverse transcriptase domain-containing protein n=1 Tax=Synaphobranchus kaupii TaxID=118154 RepID=A0A9Q1GGL9_SYNKA|nr:hypothetical protein SKAU_G00037790 [Synaphobranchus kaupii]